MQAARARAEARARGLRRSLRDHDTAQPFDVMAVDSARIGRRRRRSRHSFGTRACYMAHISTRGRIRVRGGSVIEAFWKPTTSAICNWLNSPALSYREPLDHPLLAGGLSAACGVSFSLYVGGFMYLRN